MRIAILCLCGTVALLAAGCGGGGNKASSTQTSTPAASNKLIALISDIGKFNDRSFTSRRKKASTRPRTSSG